MRHSATLPFWKPKFEAWRRELASVQNIEIRSDRIDFHEGTNKPALKAALCFVIDEDPHHGKLIASFLSEVVALVRRGPDWRDEMSDNSQGRWTGNQWCGLAKNHIMDPMVWFSCAHLYDVIYEKGFLSNEDAQAFEEIMALCHQVACLHEENLKLDNNRAAWLMGGSYLSTLFDTDPIRAKLCRDRCRETMFRFLDTILEDGVHYEIGPYGPGTIAAMQVFARCVRGAEGIDFFQEKVNGIGFEEAYRAWVGMLIPGSSLRFPFFKDRFANWDSICAGYLEYHIPELGWAISRMGERDWVPMFQHWPQGFEFYTYREPDNAQPPRFLHSHFSSAGIALLRTSWANEASTMYFRYGFQGSSHGGGLDKLNFELTCNDEPLISDGLNFNEFSHHKNVVIVDGHDQEQCSGKLLYSSLKESEPVQFLSALGGFGTLPDRLFLHDPRTEFNNWCTQNQECFPGVARMRRTVALVQKRFFLLRDTLWSLDGHEHDCEWLFQTFAKVNGLAPDKKKTTLHYTTKRRNYWERVTTVKRIADQFTLSKPGHLDLESERASLAMIFSAQGAPTPKAVNLAKGVGRYAYAGSSETGEGMSNKSMTTISLGTRGRDVTFTTLLIPTVAGQRPLDITVEKMESLDLDHARILLNLGQKSCEILINESDAPWHFNNRQIAQGIILA